MCAVRKVGQSLLQGYFIGPQGGLHDKIFFITTHIDFVTPSAEIFPRYMVHRRVEQPLRKIDDRRFGQS
jgi:hypothetical protein